MERGYFPYYVTNNNGFVVEPRNLEELYQKTKIILDDGKLANEMGQRGKEIVKKYNINIIGEQLVNLYQEYL